jgi:hypothetical protein
MGGEVKNEPIIEGFLKSHNYETPLPKASSCLSLLALLL